MTIFKDTVVVLVIFSYSVWICVNFVNCNNISREWKLGPELIKMKFAQRARNNKLKITANNTSTTSLTSFWKTKGKVDMLPTTTEGPKYPKTDTDQEHLNVQKVRLQPRYGLQNKKGTTKILSNLKEHSPKPHLRTGHRNKDDKWPKLQKRRLRYQESTRITKMNMMQMDDATKPTYIQFSEQDAVNEVLSPYFIKQQMTRIATKFTNANVTIETIGRTLEYNDIILLKMTQINKQEARFRADGNKYVDDTDEKKIIVIVHGLSVMGMYQLDCLSQEDLFVQLVSYYLEHLDKFDIFFVPMANPDGYGLKKHFWNKNLSPQNACPGVNLDRNFDIAWNISRPMSSCSQDYPGPMPFSEPESRAIRDLLHRYTNKIIAYIHVHGGVYKSNFFKGDAVLYPKGYTDIQSDDDKYIDLKGEIDEAMRKANFQSYAVAVETLYNWYGKVCGTSVDYASSVYGIPYAMEFVMQLYEDEEEPSPQLQKIEYYVLVESWKRVINVVFNNIWNSFHSNEL